MRHKHDAERMALKNKITALCKKGYIDIPPAPRHPHYKADTRQGVARKYIPA